MGGFYRIVDGVAGNTAEDGVLANLRFTLQLLAASAQDQINHYLSPHRWDITFDLAEDFDNWASSVHTYWTLTGKQTKALNAISAFFDAQSYAENSTFWEVEALASDDRWEQVRQLAQAALVALGWPVEVPPLERCVWVELAE